MTMSQILRRTKKCCLKLFRKLSFANSTTPPSKRISSRISRSNNKYIQQKNRTPNRSRIAPSPEHSLSWNNMGNIGCGRDCGGVIKSEETSTTFEDDLSYDDDIPNNYNKNHFNNNLRNNHNLIKCFRIHHQQQKNNENMKKNSSATSNNDRKNRKWSPNRTILDNDDDEEIIFTENRIYIGLNERNLNKKDTINESSGGSGKNKKISSKQSLKMLQYDESVFCNKFNDNSNYKTNLMTDNGDRNDENNAGRDNNDKKCGRKLNFEVSKFNHNHHHHRHHKDNKYEQIVFEKVKYDKNKKYLQTSPASGHSQASTVSSRLNFNDGSGNLTMDDYDVDEDDDDDLNNGLADGNTSMSINFDQLSDNKKRYNNYHNNFNNNNNSYYNQKHRPISEYDNCVTSPNNDNYWSVNNERFFSENNPNDNDDINDFYEKNNNVEDFIESRFSNHIKCNFGSSWHDNKGWNKLTLLSSSSSASASALTKKSIYNSYDENDNQSWNMSPTSKSDPNSDDQIDSWDVLKSKVFDVSGESNNCWCSRRTSLCTVETWLDDELFDNSFNEELERRCASFERSNSS